MERAVYHANMAACHIKQKEYQLAIEGCTAALELDPSYMRALQRKAQAEELLGTFASMTRAKEDHEKVVETLKIELGMISPPKEEDPKPTEEPTDPASSTSPSATTTTPPTITTTATTAAAAVAGSTEDATTTTASESSSPTSRRTTSRYQPVADPREVPKRTYKPKKLDLDEAGRKKHRMLLQSSEQALKRMEPILKEMLEKEKAEMMGK